MKTKQLLAALFLIFTLVSASAQDKYEFMIIAYFADAKLITVAVDGEKVQDWDIDAKRYEKISGAPLLKKVSEYQEKGWEVMTFTNTSAGSEGKQEFYAYLRKKKSR